MASLSHSCFFWYTLGIRWHVTWLLDDKTHFHFPCPYIFVCTRRRAQVASQPFTNSLLEYTLIIIGHTLSSLQKQPTFHVKNVSFCQNLSSLELSQHSTWARRYVHLCCPPQHEQLNHHYNIISIALFALLAKVSRTCKVASVRVVGGGRHRDGHHHTPTHANVRIAKRFVYSALPAKVCRRWLDDINIPFPDEPTATLVSPKYLQRKALKHWDRVYNAILHMRKHSICFEGIWVHSRWILLRNGILWEVTN